MCPPCNGPAKVLGIGQPVAMELPKHAIDVRNGGVGNLAKGEIVK